MLLRARRKKRLALRSLLPVALAGIAVAAAQALLFSWRAGIVNRYDEKYDEQFRQLPVIRETLKRLPLLPDPMWKEMTDHEVWAGFWWCTPVVLLAGAGAFRRRPARPLVAAIGGSIAVFFVAYGLTPWNAAELVHPTWNRFLVQLSLPLFVLLAMALRAAERAARRLRTIAPVSSGSPEAGAGPAFRPFVRESLWFFAFLALTVAVTWPWARHLRDTAPDAGDPYLNSWIMWWDWWATFHQPFHLFDGNIFFPLKYSLAFSEHNYGIALLFFPAYALGIRPLTVQGVATLLGFAFSGYGAFRLTRTLTGSTGAGLVAGIAFAFTPYRYHQLSHVNYLFSGWIPIVLEAMVLFVRKRTPNRASWLGVAFLMNGLSVIHWLVLTLVPLAAVGLVLAVRQRAERDPDLWKRGALALGAAGVALLPFLIPYQKASKLYGMVRNPEETLAYSALPKHWLTSSPTNRLWGWLGSPAEGELALFPGLLMLLLPVAAYFLVGPAPEGVAGRATTSPSRRTLAILDAVSLAAGTLALFVSFWPIHLHLFGKQVLRATDPGRAFAVLFVALAIRWCLAWPRAFRFSGASLPDSLRGLRRDDALIVGLLLAGIGFLGSFGLRLPFHRVLYETVFLFRSIRAPARWAMVAHLGLALLAGLGALRIAERLAARKPGRPVAAAVFGAAALAMLFELYAPLKTVVMRGEADPDEATLFLKATPMKGGIVELPVSDAVHGNYRYVLRAADHGKPLVNGVSGFGVAHVEKLEELLRQKPVPPELLNLLESTPVSYLVVHSSWYSREDLDALRIFLSGALRSGRLRFVGRFGPARDDIFAVAKTEPQAMASPAPLWKLESLGDLASRGREDEGLLGSIDDPGEGAAVTGELLVRGWARRPDEDLAVTVLIDGEVSEPASFKRVDRPDVCSAIPKMKRCETAGYEARIPFTPGAAGRHELTVLFRSSDGRYRFYPARPFTWKPPG